MIGWLAATVLLAFSPWLLPPWLWPCLGGPVAILVLRGRLFWAGLLVALLVCSLRGQLELQQRLPVSCHGRSIALTGQVASLPRRSPVAEGRLRQRFEFLVDRAHPRDCAAPRRVLLSYYGDREIKPGQWWRFESRLRRPWGLSNPGSFNMQAWYALSGIDAVGTVRSAGGAPVAGVGPALSAWHHRLRARVSNAIGQADLSDVAAAVLAAITVADKSGIDYRLWQLFQHYGINHLLVISGLHVALVAGLAFWLGKVSSACLGSLGVGQGRYPVSEVAAFTLALAYAALAGFSVATQRALVMLGCFLLARALRRGNSGFNSLFLAAWLLSLINPLVFLGTGFWLSFGAVATLLWLGCWQRGGRLGRVLLPQLAMALAMLPMGALWFGGSSWVSPLANLLMIPLLGLYVIPLSLLGASLALAGAGELAAACWQMAAKPLDTLWPAAGLIDRQAALFLPVAGGTLATVVALIGAALLVMPLTMRWRLGGLFMILPLLLARPAARVEPQLDVLDVGQGTAVVFRASGRVLLYDTGGGNPAGPNLAQTVVLPWLRHAGVERIDELVISHNDLDHSAGLKGVLAAMPVDRLWQGEASDARARRCLAGAAWSWPGGTRFRFLSPSGPQEGNDASCVLQIVTPGLRILLPGDISERQERELIRYWGGELRSEVLLVAHHGSNTSTYQAWLNRVAPEVAVIAAGYASRFGHPHPQVLARLQRSGAVVYQTAGQGALQFRIGPAGALSITANRAGYKAWWM
ncbi:DNA internalization-related competence protein ComEC/Rec2 [Seongchinamella unica]|nr:DNA internalization-related competence protein ComEC/Rec2 [Seongchinamella unica]